PPHPENACCSCRPRRCGFRHRAVVPFVVEREQRDVHECLVHHCDSWYQPGQLRYRNQLVPEHAVCWLQRLPVVRQRLRCPGEQCRVHEHHNLHRHQGSGPASRDCVPDNLWLRRWNVHCRWASHLRHCSRVVGLNHVSVHLV
ncbi:hypothetical protein EXIGLDRAFT_845127, partial [Exidia glandulosa HHB12029]